MSKSHRSKHSGSSRGRGNSGSQAAPQVSFLFVVNKLIIGEPELDDYHHYIPPRSPAGYSGEISSKVMRYSDGDISEAWGYHWYRDGRSPTDEAFPPGQLLRLDQEGNFIPDPATGYYVCANEYTTFAVAACNPLLPIMVVDHDPLVSRKSWDLLRIFHPRNYRGLSQVVTLDSPMGEGGAPVRYVAGKSPSWVPGLLPRTYRSPHLHPPDSMGLGGELPIILGLMALTPEQNHDDNEPTNQLFLGRNGWRRNEWKGGNDAPKGYPGTAQDDPCAFLIKVFMDPDNPGCTTEHLRWVEWNSVLVRESSRSH